MACISGITLGGYYNYIDCCGLNQTGLSSGLENVCVDVSYSGSAVGVLLDTTASCSINCNQGPLSYNFQVTGVCSAATGTVIINGFGGTLPYTIDPVTPTGSGLSTITGNGPFTYTGLTGGTYVFRLNDSLGLQNNELYINLTISNCFTANINDITGTTCGLSNGTLSVSATSTASPYSIILYKDGNFDQLGSTNTLPYVFNSLDTGVYYAEIYDYGYSTAKTENVVISASTGVDFGFWKVNSSNCVISGGKLAATGVTGNPPYTYLWSNGETDQIITGLTQGIYSCTITDSLGCQTTKSEYVGNADPLVVGLVTPVNPDCFLSNGSLTYTIAGGTRPLYYSASTGQASYTFGDTFTITNLASGSYSVLIRDANFCSITSNNTLITQNSFSVVDSIVTNSNCSQNDGSIYVELQGPNNNYTYYLSGQTTGYVNVYASQEQSHTFSNLSNDNYLLIISGNGTSCFYSNNVTVNSDQKFNVTTSTTGSTCGSENGIVTINVGNGYSGTIDYTITGPTSLPPIIDTTLSSNTFNNLSEGEYTVTITDQQGCQVSESFIITTTGTLISSVNTTSCVNGNDGQAQVMIFGGDPTFTYEWSSNVPPSQTGSTVNGLSGGSYSVKVTDSNGCSNTHNFNITCLNQLIGGYEVINICNDDFTTTTANKRGFDEMLNEGFIDITSGYTNCVFTSATFTCNVSINGSAYTQNFYTTNSLNDYPQDSLWISTIENILSTITEIGSYTLDPVTNQIKIKSKCDGDMDELNNSLVSISLTINYGVYCLYDSYKQFQDLTYFEFMTGIPYEFQ